jgi:glycosyltransferase involved in cell wall biosynthesis
MEKILKEQGYTAQIHAISNGIHEEFVEAGKSKVQNLQLSKSPDGKFKIMMIGRLSREKRQDVIIKALQYSKYGDRIQLVFAGRGPEYKRYLKLSKGLANPPLFTFLSRSQLIEELLSTDLYVHASDMESEAISCIEAFATGLVPVIANSDNSATPQFALDERSLFKAGDPKDLARAIDYWLDRPNERHFMEAKYRDSARKYSLSNCVKQFEQMLRLEARNDEMRYRETA